MLDVKQLNTIKATTLQKMRVEDGQITHRILIGMGTCGIAAGAQAVYDFLIEMKDVYQYPIDVLPTGCLGMCMFEPMVEVVEANDKHTMYIKMDPLKMKEILHHHIKEGYTLYAYTLQGAKDNA